mgnify:CR=1 FL=1
MLRTLEINPNEISYYMIRGHILLKIGEFDKAISDYSRVIQSGTNKEDIGGAYYHRSVAYYDKKEYDNSWRDLHKAEEYGFEAKLEFIKELKNKSGREK